MRFIGGCQFNDSFAISDFTNLDILCLLLVSLDEDLSILLIFSQSQLFVSLILGTLFVFIF